jgi:hypothetical protein
VRAGRASSPARCGDAGTQRRAAAALLRAVVAALVTTVAATAAAQDVEVIGPVLPRLVDVDLRRLPRAPAWRPGDPIREIPRRHYLREAPVAPAPRRAGPDPLLALQEATAPRAPDALGHPTLNISGQGFTGSVPPDTVGDVGASHYVQMVNGDGGASFAVYNKTGGLVAGPFALDVLGAAPCDVGRGDPIVLYDALADRWLLSELASLATLCVYVSQTGDPVSGGWYAYAFPAPSLPDYPKYAAWPDAYYVTTNETDASPVYVLERAQMLAGGAATAQRLTAPHLAGFSFQALTPADLDGPAPPPGSAAYLMRHRDDEAHEAPGTPQDFLEVWQLSVDWNTPAASTLTPLPAIAVAEFDSDLCGLTSFSCFPQPGSGIRLDPLREVIMWRLSYRNAGSHETLVGNLVTDVDGTDRGGIRWFELRRVGGGAWTLHQEGTFSPDATNRWMGAIAIDGAGNIAVAYNVVSSTVAPGLRYTGRRPTDPPGTLLPDEEVVASGTLASATNRYGDYAALSVDPSDDCTFWVTGEYNASSLWSTRIATFRFRSCLPFTTFVAEAEADDDAPPRRAAQPP